MRKIYILWGLFLVSTLLFGAFLGKLDFFGFLDGRHEVNSRFLIGVLFTSYSLIFTTVLIDLSNDKNEHAIYAISAALFVGVFALFNGNILAALASGVLFIIFLWIISREARKRLEFYIRLVPSELFFPILKKGILFIVGMFAVINFFHSQIRLESDTLISPDLVRTVSKPFIVVFNKQLESQLKNQLGDHAKSTENSAARRQIVEFVLNQTIQSTLGKQSENLGINANAVPVEKAVIYDNGAIDVAPVINLMADDISVSLNERLQPYFFIAPFVVALATIVIFQQLLWPIEVIESYLSRLIFFILLKIRFVNIKKETREVERLSL